MPYKIEKKGAKHCVVKEGGAQVACHDDRPAALKQMRALYANEKAELAHDAGDITCWELDCARAFLDFDQMVDHAEAVHTFNDIQQMLREKVREEFGQTGDHKAGIPWVHVWIQDAAPDWLVFEREAEGETNLYKVGYSIVDNKVTLGTPVEVVRRTVYDPVKKD